jgi:hypothetical protein
MAHGRGRGPGAWLVATLLTACGGGSGGTESPADAETPAPDAARPEIDAEGDVPDSTVRDAAPTPADAASTDAAPEPADAASTDAQAPDAAPGPVDLLCRPCTAEGACEAAGSICLTNQATGEQFCGVDCSGMGECPRGSQCFDLGEGNMQCAPTQATCAGWPPSDLGAPCDVDATCRRGADQCVLGFCTLGCASDAECPNGFRTCLAGVCQPDWMGGPEGCGLGATACAADDGSVCWQGDADHPLPATVRPFDTMPCDDDAQCNAGARCGLIGGARRCVPAPCACLDESTRGPLDDALALTGLTRCDAIFTRESMDLFPENLRADGWRLPFYDRIHRESPRALDFGRALTTQWAAAESEGGAARVLIELGATLLGAPLPASQAPGESDTDLLESARAIWAAGGDLGRFRPEVVTNAFSDVPVEVQSRVATLLSAAARVAVARDAMLTAAGIDAAQASDLFDRLPGAMVAMPGGVNFGDPREVQRLQGTMPLGGLIAASAELARVVESMDWAPIRGLEGFRVDLPTPLGRLVVQDAGVQRLGGEGHFLLVLDLGGNDRYEAAVATTRAFTEPVSVLVDLAGNDRYGYAQMDNPPEVVGVPPADGAGRGLGGAPASRSETPRQGAGILGAGLLFDLGGDDEYLSLRLSQGAAVGGVGLLVDAGGTDHYGCEQGCQAAAAIGVAALIDRGADDDVYDGVQMVQGFAGIRGVAYLHEAGGAERYTALPGDPLFGGTILYGNPQNPAGSNSSFGQGAGFGRRADADGTYASGGLGVLQDLGGDDVYTVDIFGQATGYWFGTGILRDVSGADVYNGRWYVQGSSAHFAMSLFYEDAGDDRYNEGLPLVDGEGMLGPVILATATGQGHDFSVGVLVDSAGTDHYVAPGLGVGGGNDNGIGYFIDAAGDDRYDVPDGTTFGQASIGDRGAPFESAMCLGIFIDAAGADTYAGLPAESLVGDGRTWSIDARKPGHKPGEHGAGLDLNSAP